MGLTEQDADVLREAVKDLPGGALVTSERGAALERFLQHGIPSTREEDWKYTDLAEAAHRYPSYAALLRSRNSADNADKPISLPARTVEHSTRLVLVDGHYRPDLSDRLPPCVQIDDRAREDAPQFADRLPEPADAEAPLRDLNSAFLATTVRITVPDAVVIGQSIEMLWYTRSAGLSTGRVEVNLGRNSRLTLIERHESAGAALSNNVTLFNCGEASCVSYCKLQLESTEAVHLAQQYLSAGADSRAELMHIDLGAQLGRNDLRIVLAGAGSEVNARGLFCVDGARHLDNHARIDHVAPRTTSVAIYRGIADGNARAVFSGNVVVASGASGTNARLTNQNLLLTTTAEIDSTPALQINADDVKCSHGSTTGQLDSSAVFYLRSRGIGEDEARDMLMGAFAAELLAGTRDQPLRDALQAIVRGHVTARRSMATLN